MDFRKDFENAAKACGVDTLALHPNDMKTDGRYYYEEHTEKAYDVAAELSLKAEARIDELEILLSQMIYASIPVSNAAYNLAWQHRDQVGVHENISILDGVRNSASKLLKEK